MVFIKNGNMVRCRYGDGGNQMSFYYNNTIRFENGIQHTFSEDEIYILKSLLEDASEDVGEKDALDNLKIYFWNIWIKK